MPSGRCGQRRRSRAVPPRLGPRWCYRYEQAQIVERVVPRRSFGWSMAEGSAHTAVPAVAGGRLGRAAAPFVRTAAEPLGDAGDAAERGRGADRRLDRKTIHGPGEEPEPREQKEEDDAPSRHTRQPSVETLRSTFPRAVFRPGCAVQSPGPIIFSGRTRASNSASSSRPSARAEALSVVPSACAFLATLAALS